MSILSIFFKIAMNKSEPNIPSQTPKICNQKKSAYFRFRWVCILWKSTRVYWQDRLISDYYARGNCEFINGVCFKDLSLLDRSMEDCCLNSFY